MVHTLQNHCHYVSTSDGYFETTNVFRFGAPFEEGTNSFIRHLLPDADALRTLPPVCAAKLAAFELQDAASAED